MVNAILIMVFLLNVFGQKKGFPIYLRHTWLLNWTPGKNVMINTGGLVLSIPLVLEGLALLKSDYEKHEQDFVNNLSLNADSVVLDIGANMGVYTISAALQHLKQVISIEASPTYYKKLQYNCQLNNVSNVLFLNKAVSDKNDETIEFYEGVFSTVEKEFLPDLGFPEEKIKKVKVNTITIDSLLEKEKIDQISLLKMDIEGAEVLALKGASSSLKQKKIMNMIIEYHTVKNKNYIINLLNNSDYKFTVNERRNYVENKEIENGHIIASIENTNILKIQN